MNQTGWMKAVLVGIAMFSGLLAGVGSAQELPGAAPALVDEVTDEVRWQAWGAETFKRAREENKPVMVSIEARWQYDSQYLRLVAYQDQALAKTINSEFIPMRVDADQRPDIARRYAPEGLPTVLFLNPNGLPLKNAGSGQVCGGFAADGEQVRQWCQQMLERDREAKMDRLAAVEAEPLELKAAKADLFTNDFVRIILRNIAGRYDEPFGGYGDAEKRYSGKRPEVHTLRLLLLAAELWKDRTLLEPLSHTLRRMVSGSFYQQGFGEVADSRDWNRLRDESTLVTNMALMEIYLRAYEATGENFFMEIVYRTMDDTVDFQDIFLRKGFGGAFYSARRAMVPSDFDRGLSRGPLIQSLITPWSARAIQSYFLMSEATRDPRWQERGLKALDFLGTEMVGSNSRVAYSLDRDAPGVDTIFAAQPALAEALLEALQRTSERRYLEQAERLMQAAQSIYWVEPGFYSDVALSEGNIGWLKQPRVDLDANAKAVEVLLALAELTGKEDYRQQAKQVLESLAGEAQVKANDGAAFAVAVLKYIHSPVRAIIVGDKTDPRTLALRDSALALDRLHLLVEVLDPEADAERVQRLGYADGNEPRLFLRIGLVSSAALTDLEGIETALEELEQRAQR